MRLTTRTDLAVRVLMQCAVNAGRQQRSADIAEACHVSVNHLMQVVPVLHRNGFVQATRGRAGGVCLARDPAEISLGAVFRIFESGLPFAECFNPDGNSCPLIRHCRMRPALEAALNAFYENLDGITLADLVADNPGLHSFLVTDAGRIATGCEGTLHSGG